MTQPKTLSDDYRSQLQEKHVDDNTWGNTGQIHYQTVLKLIGELNAKSVLDYGCGKGTIGSLFRQDQKKPDFPYKDVAFYEYDPAIPEKADDKHQADLVICTDVMEHIEPDFLDNVMADIAHRTLGAAFLVISCRPAIHRLPDGRNAHLIIESPQWWFEKWSKLLDITFAEAPGDLFLVMRPRGFAQSAEPETKQAGPGSQNNAVQQAIALMDEKKYAQARILLLGVKDHRTTPEALFYLGEVFFETNDLLRAAGYYLEYAQYTKDPNAYRKAGIAFSQIENYTAALKCLELDACKKAFAADADYREALMLSWVKTLKPQNTILLYESHQDNTPLHTAQYIDALIMLQDLQKACDAAQNAVQKNPERAELWSALERAWNAARQFDKALEASQKAAALDPESAVYQCNLGLAHLSLAHIDEALACFDRATEIDKLMMAPYLNRSTIHRFKKEYLSLSGDLENALNLDPVSPDVHYAMAVAALKTEDYKKGFAELEWYWHKAKLTSARMPETTPRWYGEDIRDKTIMFYADQGIGDIIMMMRYIPDVVKKYAPKKLIINVNPKMEALFTTSFPEIFEDDQCEFFDETKHAAGSINCLVAATTLPHIFNNAIDEIPHTDHYLKKDKALDYKTGTDKEFVVGISWHTKSLDAGYIRSLKLKDFAFLAKYKNVRVLDLQYGDTLAERTEAAAQGFDVHHDDSVDSWVAMQPFMDQIAACDLVISIDNTTVHAAGAMGVPCWTILAQEPFWRWPISGDATPWYQSLRLYRQKQKDYTELFERIETDFKKFLNGDNDVTAPIKYERIFPIAEKREKQAVLINDTGTAYSWGHYASAQGLKDALIRKGYDVESISTLMLNWFPVHKPSLQDFDDWRFLAFWRYKNPTLFHAIQHTDHVIINGDGMMNGLSDTALHLLYLAYVSKAFFGKKVSIINHSVYPEDKPSLSDPQRLAFYHKVYTQLDTCVVRDQISYELLRSINIPCTLGLDTSLLWLADYMDGKPAIAKTDTAIITSGPGYNSSYAPLFAKLCAGLREQGLTPVLVKGAQWHVSQEDLLLEKDLVELVGDTVVVKDIQSVESFVQTLLGARIVISGFMQICLMAGSAGIRVQPLTTGTTGLSFMGLSKTIDIPSPVFYEDPSAYAKLEKAIAAAEENKSMLKKWSKISHNNTVPY